MLPFFFKHYDPIVRKYVVFDDGSTDDSLAMLKKHPKVELRPMPVPVDTDSRIVSQLAVLEESWQESKGDADWVIVTDIDELIWHPNLAAYLRDMLEQGVTVIPALGFDMIAEDMPQARDCLTDVVVFGAPTHLYSKINIFSPNAIQSMRFTLGRHHAKPLGRVQIPADDKLFLLHYKYLGFDRLVKRNVQYLTRQRSKDLQYEWGAQYSWDEQRLRQEWQTVKLRAINVKMANSQDWEKAGGKKWWPEQLKTHDSRTASQAAQQS
ncbi:MAG: glycosyltransferase family 2 protein [Burkholderiaceae bacterium]